MKGAETPAGGPRILSVSAAPYDGHLLPVMLESLAGLGATHVEPAYIVGYTEPFDEAAFAAPRAIEYRAALRASGLRCHAFSAHIDLGLDDAVAVFTRRMEFARAIGAKIINTNAAHRSREAAFMRNIAPLARRAEALGLVIGLENPGNGEDNLFNTAAEGRDLLRSLGLPALRLNYDPGNLVSHRPSGPDPAADAIEALPDCAHLHLKDVRWTGESWEFVALGTGFVGIARVLKAMRAYPKLAIAVELPLRLHRRRDAVPVRARDPVPLPRIEAELGASLAFIAGAGMAP